MKEEKRQSQKHDENRQDSVKKSIKGQAYKERVNQIRQKKKNQQLYSILSHINKSNAYEKDMKGNMKYI